MAGMLPTEPTYDFFENMPTLKQLATTGKLPDPSGMTEFWMCFRQMEFDPLATFGGWKSDFCPICTYPTDRYGCGVRRFQDAPGSLVGQEE